MKIETNMGTLAPDQLIDELNFSCYRANRDGGMTAEALGSKHLFGPERGAAMEKRYWDEINAYANAKRDRAKAEWERDQSGRYDMDTRGGGRGAG